MISKRFRLKDFFESKKERKQYNYKQIREIKEGYYSGLPIDYIKKCCNPNYTSSQIKAFLNCFWISEEQREHCMSDLCKNGEQINQMRIGYEHGLDKKLIEVIAKEDNANKMEQMRITMECDYSNLQKQMIFCQSHWIKMLILRRCFDEKIPMDFIQLFAKNELNWKQMWQLYCGYKTNLSYSDLYDMVNYELTWIQMFELRLKLSYKNVMQDIPILLNRIIEN